MEHALALGAATRPGSTRGRDVARGARLARAPWETLCMSRISSLVRARVCVLRGMYKAGAGKLRFLSRPATVEPKSSRGEQRPRRLDLTCPEPRFSWFGLYGLYGETVVTNAVCVILFYPFLTLRIHTPFPRWTPLTHFATALLQIPRYFSRWGPLRAKVMFHPTSFPICSLIREFEKIPRPIKSPFPESVAFQEPSRRR